ncbi:MAG TPA: TonB-dependent receptor [Ideonella sp.]|uniref:TonB-dependent receptor n=1 Tax=Ideonella sp. TaxID=1929293 RepID=UPI002E330F48|nr:TonB-dependent receptor [Ideonella sp.]HEX5687701.1 TonB-dependent receptor [Ideonella sp.]
MNRHPTRPGKTLLALAALAAIMNPTASWAQDAAPAPAPAASAPPAAEAAEAKPATEARPVDTQVDTIVVTGTANRSGKRKLEAPMSITTANEEQIREAAPSTAADLLKIVPGVFAETTGGNGGGANIRVRGFPMDGDAPYTTIQLNGAPVYPVPTLSFFDNSGLFRLDDTIDRVEVLRGGSSPIYGSGQPGITVNFIQKKGGDTAEGGLRLTAGTGALRRVDGFFAGKLADKWYLSVGGFYRSANGVRDTEFPADRGGQLSALLTRKLDDGEISFSARVLDDKNAFFTGVPLMSSDNGKKLSAYPGFDPGKGTFYGNELRGISLEVAPNDGSGDSGYVKRDLADGRGARATMLGASLDKRFDAWTLSNKLHVTSADAPTYALFTGGNPQSLGDFIASQVTAANASPAVVAAAGGPATGGSASFVNGGQALTDMDRQVITAGLWTVDKKLKSFSNETRLSRELFKGNTLTGGLYLADYSSHDLWYLNHTVLMTAQHHARLVDVALNNGVLASRNGYVAPPWTYYVNADYNGRNHALFLADEWKLSDALSIDAGVRHESQRIDGTLENTSAGDLDGNPLTFYDNNLSYFNGSYRQLHYKGDATSWTLGGNYNFSRSLSAFVRANSGHKFPSFDDLRDGKRGTEHIDQYEIGLKTATPLYTAFVTIYTNKLRNSQFQVFTVDGNEVAHGGSDTTGLEFEAALRPIQNLELSLTGNLQRAKYVNFGENTGNSVSRQPKAQFRFTPSYKIPTEMGDFKLYATWTHVGDRYGDHANLQTLPAYDTLDLGAVAHLANGIDIRLTGTNVTNTLGITEGNPRLAGTGVSDTGVFMGRPLMGPAYELSVGFVF